MQPTVEQLIGLLTDPDPSTRRQAALALGSARDAAAVPALIERLGSEEEAPVLEDLTWAAVQLVESALPDLLGMLASPNPAARRQAAHVLSKIGDPSHFDALAPLVADAHDDVAIKAYRAVANTGHPNAAALLAGHLGEADDALERDALSTALQTLGSRAVEPLVQALSDENVGVRMHAVDTLGHLGEDADAAVDALVTATTDADADVRLAAVSALGQLGEVADRPLLQLAHGDDSLLADVATRLIMYRAKWVSPSERHRRWPGLKVRVKRPPLSSLIAESFRVES